MAIMATREGTGFETGIESDSASLWPVVGPLLDLLGPAIHVLRDPTRGGVASALNEIAQASGVGIELEESNFFSTVDAGLSRINRTFDEMKKSGRVMVSGAEAADM